MRDCSKLIKARKLLREYEAEKKRRKKKPSPPKPSFSKLPEPPVKPRKSNKKTGKAYGAEEEARPKSELETSTDNSDSEDEEIETCRLSKDIVGKASPSTWAGDTGASSHMSDQPSLFRRIIKIKRRLVRVGGGELYADWKGEAQVVYKDRSSTWLLDILLIPNLRVNLL